MLEKLTLMWQLGVHHDRAANREVLSTSPCGEYVRGIVHPPAFSSIVTEYIFCALEPFVVRLGGENRFHDRREGNNVTIHEQLQ